MNRIIEDAIAGITESGNLRRIPEDGCSVEAVDLSSNDYLGIASHPGLQEEFLAGVDFSRMQLTASASRLLARRQCEFNLLESTLADTYGRPALLFNSGYHANTGLISAFAGLPYFIIADKLVHASIIDGIILSGLPFARFRHNDYGHLERIAEKAHAEGKRLLIIVECVYSMDGDRADIDALAAIKRRYEDSILYVDEAHGIGVEGPAGLGLSKASSSFGDVDIIVGTLGKALASSGAFAIVSSEVRRYMVNKARSLIFSTAIPPLSALWSRFVFLRSLEMDTERQHLRALGLQLHSILESVGGDSQPSHIQPLIVGTPQKAIRLSASLREEGFDVLPIRTPTVPPGTDRLRFSLSAAISEDDIRRLGLAIQKIMID